jgi:hypothetical protein
MAELEPRARKTWPWLLGLVLLVVVLWVMIRGMAPDAPVEVDNGASTTKGVPMLVGVRAA